jgi:hypothetical protein
LRGNEVVLKDYTKGNIMGNQNWGARCGTPYGKGVMTFEAQVDFVLFVMRSVEMGSIIDVSEVIAASFVSS